MAITDYANWRNTFSNPQINQGIFGSAMNRNIFTPQALNFLGKARNVGGTALRYSGLTNPVGAAATAAYVTPKLINRLTERDANATRSSLFNIDLTKNANERAVLPSVGENAWGAEGMSPIPDDGVVPPIENINRPLPLPYQDRIMNKDLMNMDRGNIDNRGFNFPSVFGLVKGGLEGIKNQFEYKPATEEAWDPNTGQFVSAEEQDKMNALGGYYSDAARNQRRQRARVVNMIKRREAGQEYGEDNLRRLQELGYGPKETITTTVGDNINQGGGGGSEAAFTQTSPGGISQEVSRAARGDPTGTGGGWRLAQGGRIGYQGGEFVDEDINIEGPGFDVNENLMASDPGAMDSLNEMSMQIFGKGVHELSEEEYQMLIDMTNEQASAGQDQGLASLV